MKEKALFSILLLCMIVSATVMLFILKGMDSVRSRSDSAGPGGFMALMQLDKGLDKYADALRHYRSNIDNEPEVTRSIIEYQKQFNIAWGNLTHFNLQFFDSSAHIELLSNFKHNAARFLDKKEASMEAGYVLNRHETSVILKDLQLLQDQLHEIGLNYFHNSVAHRDTWIVNLKGLHKLLLFFSASLMATGSLLIALLVRSNHRKNALVDEAEAARQALSNNVAELRSGRLEQRAKDSFIATATHDLSQPLHALGLFLASLGPHVNDKEGRFTLGEAVRSSNNLGSLFKSLMDLSRLDAGIVKVEPTNFHLEQLIAMLQQEYQAKTSSKAVDIRINVKKAVVHSDPILLSRIIRNLIENALIHSDANLITVNCTEKNKRFQLEVKDNGRGIAKAEQRRVFSEYYQIENRSDVASKGLGLGLSIVRRLADLLSMPIKLQSEVGVSTSFIMDIPAGDEKSTTDTFASNGPQPSTAQQAGHVIAVVDDDENICLAMSSMLHSIGLDAIVATSADALIDNIIESEKTPSLIIADYQLQKGRTGDHAIVQVKRALNLDIPGFLITGDTAPARVAQAAQSGFDILYKPVQPAKLANKIYSMLTPSLARSADQTDPPYADSSKKVVYLQQNNRGGVLKKPQ